MVRFRPACETLSRLSPGKSTSTSPFRKQQRNAVVGFRGLVNRCDFHRPLQFACSLGEPSSSDSHTNRLITRLEHDRSQTREINLERRFGCFTLLWFGNWTPRFFKQLVELAFFERSTGQDWCECVVNDRLVNLDGRIVRFVDWRSRDDCRDLITTPKC